MTTSSSTHTHQASKRVVLITGCSAGSIGHSLALEFANQGCRVFASSRNTSKIDCSLVKKGVEIVELDVTSTQSVEAAVAKVITEAGYIDVLVNNAGQMCVGPVVEVDIDRVQRILDVNVMGAARVCQVVAPHMMDRRQGTIVNVGSVSGYVATPWVGYYAASKAALHAMSDSLRIEMQPFNVNVVVVAPGSVKSNLVDAQSGVQLLREDSRYIRAIESVRARAVLSQTVNSTPTAEFARYVVPQLLVRKPRAYVTFGGNATFIWLLYFMPAFVLDSIFSKRFGTRKLKADLALGTAEKQDQGMCPVTQRRGGQCPVGMRKSSNASREGESVLASIMTKCPVTNPVVWAITAGACAAWYGFNHPEIFKWASDLAFGK
ncbi:hypothetical protein LPJ66_000498 [Kickxella alabastrina]|uniref:Uncharacterized protein n=1 Tax=Kickxella alabastrina TaxID=61397 RepID=A0ACC1IW88_9FUNG|nr:hypothetical protein LPJ66_000498 [Kickxella alabastrina]